MSDATTETAAAAPALATPEPRRRDEVTLRFVRSYRSWNRGVEAGFTPTMADELIRRGVAVAVPVIREPLAGRTIRKA